MAYTAAEEVQARIDKLEVNMQRLDVIVNGSAITDITIDSGTVPSINKLLTTIGDTGNGYVNQSKDAATQAIAAGVTAKLMANQFTGVAVATTTNLQLRSEEFDNATYTKTNVTATANSSTAPDNTTTADKLAEQAVTGLFTLSSAAYTVTGGARYTRSIWAKAAERSAFVLKINQTPSANNASAVFDLATGSVYSVTGTGAIAAIENW